MRIAAFHVLFPGSLLLLAATAVAQPQILDDFETLDAWSVIASDGVKGSISAAQGTHGKALRLDYDFGGGAGFCVVRRDLPLTLPKNYRFSFAIRGESPPNNLEFKLVDPAGPDVWWINRRGFQFPTAWQTLSYKARHFKFAWGPSGGRPLEKIGAIEFAVAASTGGRGHILVDRLTFEPLPLPQAPSHPPTLSFSTARESVKSAPAVLDEAGHVDWTSAEGDAQPWLRVDFGQFRELGGVAIDWGEDDYATAYDVALSSDGKDWETVATVDGCAGKRSYVPLPDAEATQLRLAVRSASRGSGVRVQNLRIMPVAFAESPNSMFTAIAGEVPRGRFPRYFLRQQQTWTIVGVEADEKEALLDADGALEVDKLSFRLEPFLRVHGHLIAWADAEISQSLTDGYLPVPSVTWRAGDLTLEVTALADGPAGASNLIARYCVTNRGAKAQDGTLFIALRPFQVLPPWQDLNITGGAAQIETMEWNGQQVTVNGQKTVQPWTGPAAFGAAPFAQGDITEYLATGKLPATSSARDPMKWAAGALQYDFALAPGEQKAAVVTVPFHESAAKAAAVLSETDAEARYAEVLARVRAKWTRELNRVELLLPNDAERLAHTFKTTQAYILINADGPSIQPGSRSYERSWIRDGALTGTALLYTGHTEKVRTFIEWFSRYQFSNGKIPCVADRRGGDPVPEHDSTGEYIYLLLKYYEFTHDRDFLEKYLPQVTAGVDYLDTLRKERLTDKYRDGPPELRACYGLVPESISHEGYSAKPMHSYWDSFFVLRGLKDATTIAQILDRPELVTRFSALRDEYRTAVSDSLRLAMETKRVDYIPGCVELGDFDATSTAIAVFPCGEADSLPSSAVMNTFAKYYEFFCDRRDGKLSWENYTPYEVRLINTFVRLDQPRHAHELADFFFRDQRPPGWNAWAEVVWRDPATPKFIGDMPHTWVGSDFLNSVRSMFVYERERDGALVLAAGVKPEWLAGADGIAVKNWPTEHGTLSYALRAEGRQLLLTVSGDCSVPPGGLIFRSPVERPIESIRIDGQSGETVSGRDVLLRTANVKVVITHGQ